MKEAIHKTAVKWIVVLCAAAALNASAVLVLDFEGSHPLSGWNVSGATTDVVAFDGSNRLRIRDTTGTGANITTYALPIAEIITGTGAMEFDFYAINSENTTNIAPYLAKGTALTDRCAGYGYDDPGVFDWYTFNDGTQTNFDQTTSFAANTWYRFRIQVDVSTNTQQIFVKGGSFGNSSFTQLTINSGTSTWNFRYTATQLTHISFTAYSSSNSNVDGIYVDNIVIPEPSGMAMIMGAVGAAVVVRRRRRIAA